LHLEKICQVTEKTGTAVEILFCMAKDLYMRVDTLKAEYDELMQCISCLKNPGLAPGTGIVKCLEDYGKKLDAVITTRDELIAKIIAALELAYGMHTDLCKEYGLKHILMYWRSIFRCDGCGEGEGTGQQKKQGYKGIKGSGTGMECCELHPEITFPIDEDPYYKDLLEECAEKKAKTETLKQERDNANETRDALQACKDSLETAIKEVDPKNKCK
jgi:hypothetical protein